MHTSPIATLSREQLGMTETETEAEDEAEAEAETPPPSPMQLEWSWFGPGELMSIQEQIELMPLLTLRMTSKAVCANLDAVMPPAIRFVYWILNRPENSIPSSFRYPDKTILCEPCVLRAPTRLLLDAFVLLDTMKHTMADAWPGLPLGILCARVSHFTKRYIHSLPLALKTRIFHVIHGDAGTHLTDCYSGNTAAEHAAIHGPPLPLTEEESIALLDDIFNHSGGFTGPTHPASVSDGLVWTPFIIASHHAKVGVLRYLADKIKNFFSETSTAWAFSCDEGRNNAYAYVCHEINEVIRGYEDDEDSFPDLKFFKDVRPGETHTLYVARRRIELRAKYAPVLTYLSDELGLSTRAWQTTFDDSEEEGSGEESEEEESESESEM